MKLKRKTEYWSIGVMECWRKALRLSTSHRPNCQAVTPMPAVIGSPHQDPVTPTLHYSITPFPNTPSLHRSVVVF
jgi:hypothetical protein